VSAAERTWPPGADVRAGDVAREIVVRLVEGYSLEGIRQTGAVLGSTGWIAEVGIWPPDAERIDAVRRALAPMEVRTFAHPSAPRRR